MNDTNPFDYFDNDKVVIAPTEWHPLHKKRKFSDEDIIGDDWIRVEVK